MLIKAITKAWYRHFDSFIRSKKYARSYYDPCVYYSKLPSGEYICLLLYAYDMLITFKDRSVFDKLKKDLPFKFKMKDLGKTKKVLVMDFERDRKGHKISLMQNRYLKKVL